MLLPAPETVRARGSALEKVLAKLLRQGLVEEVVAAEVTQGWRTGDDGQRIGLRVTDAGLLAIGVEARPATAQAGCAAVGEPATAEKAHSTYEAPTFADPVPEPATAGNDPASRDGRGGRQAWPKRTSVFARPEVYTPVRRNGLKAALAGSGPKAEWQVSMLERMKAATR